MMEPGERRYRNVAPDAARFLAINGVVFTISLPPTSKSYRDVAPFGASSPSVEGHRTASIRIKGGR